MLPDPSPVLKQRSDHFKAVLVEKIKDHGGWMSFEQYMHDVLYEPDYGYYAGGLEKIGAAGDFVTAPLLGELFAHCLAEQCAEILDGFPAGSKTCVIEFGAGNGKLACDLLRQVRHKGVNLDRYLIIETSGDMAQRQRETIAAEDVLFLKQVEWLTALPSDGFHGIVIANELLDALPVKKFQINRSKQALEMGVTARQGKLMWHVSQKPLLPACQHQIASYRLPVGYQSEMGLQAAAWVRSVGEKMRSGVMLLIDYGYSSREYYHPDRFDGTLMCHYRHRAHDDPFFYPGLQDITAHVNFSAMKRAGEEIGLTLAGYANQSGFLLSLGILDRLAAYQDHPDYSIQSYLALAQQIKTLTLPGGMGESFKVMALSTKMTSPLRGFSLQNHGMRL